MELSSDEEKVEGSDEYEFAIHEVYYERNMKIKMWSDAVTPPGDSEEELVSIITKMLEATKKETLDFDANKKEE